MVTAAKEARQTALREKLLDVAELRMADGGLAALRARDLAAEAGCSVGAIYNVFEDLNALAMAVNGRTFAALGSHVTAAVAAAGPCEARARLIVMSEAYLDYAAKHTRLWRALFDLEMTVEGPVPEWYQDALNGLFALIAAPMREIYPEKSEAELDLIVRAMFSGIHGIVLLGLERRISAVPYEEIEAMMALFLGELG